jgi:hypothetical protein
LLFPISISSPSASNNPNTRPVEQHVKGGAPVSARSNWLDKFCFIAAVAVPIALSGTPMPLSAQQPQQEERQPQQQPLSQQELEQLVAPVALYPDALLAQVLTASTYPLEVAMAAQWSGKNPNLSGAALEDAMEKQTWARSVRGLTAVPQVLAMMSDKLDWTSQLGEAFLAQPDDVQNAIQVLRARADAAGNLKTCNEQRVTKVAATPSPGYVGPPEYIVIEPVVPDYIYVPVYDPVIVFGVGYWSPAYVPFFWHPPWWAVGQAFGFGPAFFVGPALWYQFNWGNGGFAAIQVNTLLWSGFNRIQVARGGQFQNWTFDPSHHSNAPFRNATLQSQYASLGGKGVEGTQTVRGIPGSQPSKGLPGQSASRGKSVDRRVTSNGFQRIQMGKGLQRHQTGKGIQSGEAKGGRGGH